ncbi:MAG TPA: glycosyltransferase family 39 protein [Edaphobacter sp.]
MDDWSYIRTVQTLAHTGHIVYNGWSASILGWQLYLGALFAKVFGFSFTAIRLSTLLVAMVTAYLIQRTLILAGVREWNATIGALALVLSPLFLSVTFSFMTDISGLFCIVLCLYACLRALQAETDRAALAWICFAAISNALGGTVRQIAWLGVLVMVPSTLWLLRRRPRFLLFGSLLYVFCGAIIFASLHWFHKQPYSVPEPLVRANFSRSTLPMFAKGTIGAMLEAPLLLLPVLILFLPVYPRKNRRAVTLLIAVCAACLLFGLLLLRHPGLNIWLAPWLRNSITIYQFMDSKAFHSDRPVILSTGARFLVSTLTIVCGLSFLAFLSTRIKNLFADAETHSPAQISWYHLGVLLVPFSLAYFALLLPRAATNELFDRYLLPLLTLSMIVILRLYQEHVQPRLPAATLLGIAVFAAFGIAGTHDSFALLRARVAVANELVSHGVPPTAFDGGFEYNSLTQIDLGRFINDPKIPTLPGDSFHASVKDSYGVCAPIFVDNYPVLSPRYGMAFDPTVCLGQSEFAPVSYQTWLGPHSNTLYIVKVGHPIAMNSESGTTLAAGNAK